MHFFIIAGRSKNPPFARDSLQIVIAFQLTASDETRTSPRHLVCDEKLPHRSSIVLSSPEAYIHDLDPLMHTTELIELAALLATHAKTIIHHADELPSHAIEEYWSASKCRQQRWSHALKSHTNAVRQQSDSPQWQVMRRVIEEILAGEVLTRIWSGVVCAHDRLRGTDEVEPVVQSTLVGHLESRNRALTLMVHGQGLGIEEAVALNRLRRRAERWTDLLLGQLVPEIDVTDFAFDMARAQDFAADVSFSFREGHGSLAWQMVLASLRAAFQCGLADASPNSDLNRRIGESILSCLPPDLFDSMGLFKSLWLTRLDCTTNETQGMIDEYLALGDSSERAFRRQTNLVRRRF